MIDIKITREHKVIVSKTYQLKQQACDAGQGPDRLIGLDP